MKYKVGEKIKTQKNLTIKTGFCRDMKKPYEDKEATIINTGKICNEDCYNLDIDNRKFNWFDNEFQGLIIDYKLCMGKWEFNFEEFKTKSIGILCNSKNEYEQVCKILKKYGSELNGDYTGSSIIYYYDSNKDWNYTLYYFTNVDFSKEIPQEREYQTGDIVFLKDDLDDKKERIAIVYGDRITYLTGGTWGYLEESKEDITRFIPVENIKNIKYLYKISQLLEEKMIPPDLEQYIVQVTQKEKTKIYQVEFTPNAPTLHNFITEDKDDVINVNDIVLCHQGNTVANTWQYCRVKNIVDKELSESDLDNYRKCKSIK